MKKLPILATVIILVAIISAYFFLTSNRSSSLSNKPTPLVNMNLAPSGQRNATQGGVTRINVTVTSLNMNETTIASSLVLQDYDNEPWHSSTTQEELFSSTFTLNPMVLESNETKKSVLTLHIGEAASVGRYTFLVELGNAQIHHLVGTTFELVVSASSTG